jgi:hypothetical protein
VGSTQNSKRKDMRVMVQETWIVQSAQKEKEGCQDWGCKNRDAATFDDIEKTKTTMQKPYQARLRTQFEGLNKKFGANFTTLVPVYAAVLNLRQSKWPRRLQ